MNTVNQKRPEKTEFLNALQLILNGRMTAARQILSREGFRKGDRVTINTKTAPTPTGDYYMAVTVEKPIGLNRFISKECDPYMGYNTWDSFDLANV